MTTAEARFVLAHGLGDIPQEPLVLDADRGHRLVQAAVDQRVVGLAAAAVTDGRLRLEPSARARLADAQRQTAGVALVLERRLLEVAALLDGLGVPFRVLKGPALAHTVYPDPGWRDFGDVDLLVPGGSLTEVITALGRSGAERVFPPVGRGFEAAVAKSVTVRLRGGWELDLHRSIAHGPWGLLIDVADLWRRAGTFRLGGRNLPTVTPELHLAHALVHVGLGSPRPRWSNLRDVAQLSAGADLDHQVVVGLLDRWRARSPAAVAAGWAAAATGADLGWLDAAAPNGRERRWLDLYRRSPQPFRRLTLEALTAPAPLRQRVQLLAALPALARRSGRAGRPVR